MKVGHFWTRAPKWAVWTPSHSISIYSPRSTTGTVEMGRVYISRSSLFHSLNQSNSRSWVVTHGLTDALSAFLTIHCFILTTHVLAPALVTKGAILYQSTQTIILSVLWAQGHTKQWKCLNQSGLSGDPKGQGLTAGTSQLLFSLLLLSHPLPVWCAHPLVTDLVLWKSLIMILYEELIDPCLSPAPKCWAKNHSVPMDNCWWVRQLRQAHVYIDWEPVRAMAKI